MRRARDISASHDYVVVGAGSAGCVVAARLAAAGHRVLILEAGGNDQKLWIRVPIGYGRTYFDRRVNWCYRTEPDDNLGSRSSYWPRGKVVGGSSSINAMVYYRGLPGDFDDWADAAGPDWSWERVLPAFESFERASFVDGESRGSGPLRITDPGEGYHAIGLRYLDAARRVGFEFNGRMIEGEGVGRYCITSRDGLRCSAADAFLRPALRRPGLALLTEAHVTRILMDGPRAAGVEFRLRGSTHKVYARREVIVSAGAINSPQLLQLSGIGPRSLLARHGIATCIDRPAVGDNLQDHLAVTYFYKSRIPTLNNQLYPWWGKVRAGLAYALARSGPLSLGVNQYGGFVRATPGAKRADVQLYFNPITYSKTPVGKRPLLNPDPYPGFILSFQPCRPASRGRVEIASADPAASPAIRPGYLSNEGDLDTVVRGGRLVARLARADELSAVIAEGMGPTPEGMSDAQIVEDFRTRADTVFHPVGTCAMGTDPATSVVDQRLRVHGAKGLRVIDASVFPNITSGNTNAPTIMVGWRGAQMVADDARTAEST